MKRSTTLSLATVALGLSVFTAGAMAQGQQSSSPAPGQAPAQKSFVDRFVASADTNWGPDDAYSYIAGGRFRFHVPAKQHAERYTRRYPSTEVDIKVDVVAGPKVGESTSAGLIFWANGTGKVETLFLIDPIRGRFAVFSAFGRTLTPVQNWKPAPTLQVGGGKTNHLEVVASADEADFLINGKIVDAEPGADNTSGPLIGLYAAGSDSGPADYAFSNFSAHAPVAPPPKTQSAMSTVWNYINGPLSKAPDAGISFVGAKPTTGMAPGQMLFTDDFKTHDPDWGDSSDYSYVKDGRFEFHAPAKEAVNRYSNKYSVTDVEFEADIVAGPATKAGAAVGLSFWADGSGDTQTLFLIDPIQGSFAIDSEVADKTTAILDWGNSPLIQIGNGKTNHLEVIAEGKLARFVINGHQVAQMAAPSTLPGELIGLYAAGSDTDPGDFGFSHFSAKIPVESSLAPGTAAAPATAPGKAIFADDFKSLDPSWGVADAASSAMDGRLRLSPEANESVILVNDKYAYDEADVSASIAEQAGGPSDALYGLVFWAADINDYVLFVMQPGAGTFAVFRQDLGKSTTLLDWTNTHALDAGIGKINRVGVALRKDKAFLLINGRQVGEIPAPANPPGALIGLYGEAGVKAAAVFDVSDFSVTAPTGEGPPEGVTVEPSGGPYVAPAAATAAAPAPSAAPGSVIFADDFKAFDPSWGVSNDSGLVRDGKLELRSASDQEIVRLNSKYSFEQAAVEVSVVEEGNGTYGPLAGLLFWASDASNYTLFAVDPISGKFAAFRETDDKNTTLSHWTPTAALNTGVGKTNQLAVLLQADRAIFLVNGQQVGEVPMPARIPGGLVGLYGGGDKTPGSFDYSDFIVKALPADGAANVANTAETASTDTGQGSAQTSSPTSGDVAAPSTASATPSDTTSPQAPAASTDVPPAESTLPAPRAPSADEQLALEDDFQAYSPTWGIADNQVFARDGRMMMHIPGRGFAVRVNGGYYYYDADISFAAQVVSSDSRESGVELIFWAQDRQNYYYVYVGASGTLHVMRLSGNKTSEVVAARPSPAIKAGVGQWNAIELLIRGKQATLRINGTDVAEFSGTPPALGGAFGLAGYSGGPDGSILEFANLRVSVPRPVALRRGWSATSSARPVPALTTDPGKIIAADDFQTFGPSWGKPDGVVEVRNGVLAMESQNAGNAGILNYKYLYRDADIQVGTLLVESAKLDTAATLYFWASDRSPDLYMLSVTPLGYFRVAHRFNGQTQNVLKWQTTLALTEGQGAWNDIGVSLRGGQGTVLINGKAVGRFTGQPPPQGSLIGAGMQASRSGISAWDFRNLKLSAPANSAGQ